MVEKMLVKVVGSYTENDWQNPRTGEKVKIKSITLVLQQGKESFVAEASDATAERVRDLNLRTDMPVLASLYFDAQQTTKDNQVRYFQRVRIADIVPIVF